MPKYEFHVNGEVIQTKKAMKERCQDIMDNHAKTGREFRSQTLADLVAGYHYFCAPQKLRPDRFRKDPPLPGYSGYYLMAHFPDLPGDGWHGVAWTKCIDHPTFEFEVAQSIRRRLVLDMAWAKQDNCEECGITAQGGGKLQVDHSDPTIAEIVAEMLPLFTEEERGNWLGFNWREAEEFTIPANHQASALFEYRHLQCTLTTLCIPCHQKVGKDRRAEE